MEKADSTELSVEICERLMVKPCLPSPNNILQLSSIDNLPGMRVTLFNSLLVYNGRSDGFSVNPAQIIREALSKVLVYYPAFAGRFRKKENGELEVECTGEGALFLEAMAESDLSVLGDLDDYNPSYQRLLFSLPLSTQAEDLHPLVLQVTCFTCGGFIVGVSFHHSICDGRGASQFLQALAEIARGEIKPSVEPIWNRELVKPEDPIHLQLLSFNLINRSTKVEEIVQASLVINSETINYIKKCVMEECNEFCSAFEIIVALTWVARTKAFQIPQTENVMIFYGVDMRRSFNPPLPKGYYGNAIGTTCAIDNVKYLVNGSLLRVVMIIKKSKVSLNKNFRERIVMNPFTLDVNMKNENVVGMGDWRRLGFHEVDFGWGDPVYVSPMQQKMEDQVPMQNYFIFLRPSKSMPDGIKILMFMPKSRLKLFKTEMEAMINKYVN